MDKNSDQSKKSPKSGIAIGQSGKFEATRESIASGLSETHPTDVIEAVTIALRDYEEYGELPEVIQISERSRTDGGEWLLKVSTFNVTALDRQLRKSSEFELISSDSTKQAYKFTFRTDLQQLLPRQNSK